MMEYFISAVIRRDSVVFCSHYKPFVFLCTFYFPYSIIKDWTSGFRSSRLPSGRRGTPYPSHPVQRRQCRISLRLPNSTKLRTTSMSYIFSGILSQWLNSDWILRAEISMKSKRRCSQSLRPPSITVWLHRAIWPSNWLNMWDFSLEKSNWSKYLLSNVHITSWCNVNLR